MSRPLLLDLFCGAGGAAAGYYQAGFEILGVDVNPQPNYPFAFKQGDALEWGEVYAPLASVIHASPPCQAFSSMRNMPDARPHPRLIEPVREMLAASGKPYVIENVPGAPLDDPVLLCGSMFGLGADGFELRRHRLFETNWHLFLPGPCRHRNPVIGVYGGHVRCRSSKYWRASGADFPGRDKKHLAMTAMGVEHPMTMNELSEAIPPAYTRFVGEQLLQVLELVA